MAPGLDEFDVLLEVVLSLVRVMPTVSWRYKVLNHRSKDFYFFMYIFGWFSQEFLLESYRYACLANPASASDNLIDLDFYRSPVSFAQK